MFHLETGVAGRAVGPDGPDEWDAHVSVGVKDEWDALDTAECQ